MAEGETSRINFTSSSVDATHDFNGASIIVSVDPAVGLDVDDNGTEDALTDGVLILRHLFGFSGQTLTDGALSISPAANRDNPSDITNYLSGSHSTMLDVDGNGEADALTDGILILRYMFGFSGPQLVDGALGINPQATRTEPADVIAFLDGYRTRSNQQTIQSQSLGLVPIQPLNANLESFSQKVAPSLSAAPLQSANATDTRPSQIVAGVNPIVGGEAGESVTVAIRYETSDNNNLLSGLGVRTHFDSSQLQYRGVVDVLANNLIQRNDPVSDAADFDNDPNTDQFVLIAWADFAPPQEWPNQPLPVGLFDAEFTIASELPIGTRSNINFTASSTSPTHSFQTTPVEVIVEEEARLSIAPATINILEGDTGLSEFTVTRSGSTRGTATAEYTVTGTGEQPADANDFGGNLPTGTLMFNDGDINETITVLVSGDVDVEGIESFTVTLNNPVSAPLQTATAEGIILNDDTTVSINLAPMSVIEDGSDKLVYELTRAGQTDEPLTVHFTVNGSASLARDYTGIDENDLTVNFDAGASTAVITIEPVADTDIEADETVVVSMVANADYTISGSAVATGTITNDDVPPTVIVSVSPPSVSEDGDGELDYTFTRVGNASEALTLIYTVGGTAAAGTHFDALTGTVTIDAGADTAIVTVDPTDNDTIDGDKTLSLTLTRGTNYDLGTIITAVGTIVDNDEAGFNVSQSAVTVSEAGTSETFTVVLTAEPVSDVVLDVVPADSNEVSVDQATLTFTPANWNVAQTVTVTGVDDSVVDGDQVTWLKLLVVDVQSDPTYHSLPDQTLEITTIDDDMHPSVSVSVSPASAAEDGDGTLILFHTLIDTVIDVNDLESNSLVDRYFLLDEDLNQVGEYQTGQFRAALQAGRTFALVIRPDTVSRLVSMTSSAGSESLARVTTHNMLTPTDVTGEGDTTSVDALRIINQLNAQDAFGEQTSTANRFGFTDVNRDGNVTALDALLVINFMNQFSPSGEAIPSGQQLANTTSVTWPTASPSNSIGSQRRDREVREKDASPDVRPVGLRRSILVPESYENRTLKRTEPDSTHLDHFFERHRLKFRRFPIVRSPTKKPDAIQVANEAVLSRMLPMHRLGTSPNSLYNSRHGKPHCPRDLARLFAAVLRLRFADGTGRGGLFGPGRRVRLPDFGSVRTARR